MHAKVSKLSAEDRMCVLSFDEMALKADFTYYRHKDKVVEVEDDG